jgi:competence protein ComFC
LINFVKDNRGVREGIDAVTFVPLEKRRLRERGFNQSRILASSLSKEFGIPLVDALEKIRVTKHQNELSREDRLTNLGGAFRVKNTSRPLKGLKVLLIDDVMTTGATLNACSLSLFNEGAAEIRCLTLARGVVN